ncbi:MAG: AAA family ATPase [Candidatus Asgardarchaeia archaeon]
MINSKHLNIDSIVADIKRRFRIVGRDAELRSLVAARMAGKHVLIEGPVGVGKTKLAMSLANYFDQKFIRLDGDERFTEAKLVGFFDPPLVVKMGWCKEAFLPGPLTKAMEVGGILLINEINRLPEGAQNALLPALDEGIIEVPKLGMVRAKDGFMVIATQNPEEYVGTNVLSEALKDRFVWIRLDYQSEEEEREIVKVNTSCNDDKIVDFSVRVVRKTREHRLISRGSSVRGAIDMVKLFEVIGDFNIDNAIRVAVSSLGKKIEVEENSEKSVEDIIEEIVREVFSNFE